MNKLRAYIDIIDEANAAVAPAAGGVLKTIGKRILPGAGVAFGAQDAYRRAQAGDNIGAGIAGVTAAASAIPGIGTAAAIGGTAAQLAYDKWRTGKWGWENDTAPDEVYSTLANIIAQLTPYAKSDPDVAQLLQVYKTKVKQ